METSPRRANKLSLFLTHLCNDCIIIISSISPLYHHFGIIITSLLTNAVITERYDVRAIIFWFKLDASIPGTLADFQTRRVCKLYRHDKRKLRTRIDYYCSCKTIYPAPNIVLRQHTPVEETFFRLPPHREKACCDMCSQKIDHWHQNVIIITRAVISISSRKCSMP